mmetsp:Transcript_33753/g.71538  ORF Transcript_33753/g.71538 Transcript_33753/m.71538 type:complete len:215 (+) Transcript_33753:866-1510(+)
MNPSSSTGKPHSESHFCAAPCVHHNASVNEILSPFLVTRVPFSTPTTSCPVCNSMPRSLTTCIITCCTAGPWLGHNFSPRPINLIATLLPEEAPKIVIRRARSAIATSAPLAPPPTIAISVSSSTRARRSSSRAEKLSIGFTAVTPTSRASATDSYPDRPRNVGEQPILIDAKSYLMGGRPSLQWISRFSLSILVTDACTNRALACRAILTRST